MNKFGFKRIDITQKTLTNSICAISEGVIARHKLIEYGHAMLLLRSIEFLARHNFALLGGLQDCRVTDQLSRWVRRVFTAKQLVKGNIACIYLAASNRNAELRGGDFNGNGHA